MHFVVPWRPIKAALELLDSVYRYAAGDRQADAVDWVRVRMRGSPGHA